MASYETSAELRRAVEAAETVADAKLAKLGKLSASARMKLLFDEGTFVETGKYIGRKSTELDSGEDDSLVNDLMNALSTDGKYEVSKTLIESIQEVFDAGCCDEASVDSTIKEHFEKYNYLCDTHTAVAVNVYDEYVARTGDDIPTVIDSTASPYKFSKSVLTAILDGKKLDLDEFDMVGELNTISGVDVPKPLQSLKDKAIRFDNVCDKENMSEMVFKLLKL